MAQVVIFVVASVTIWLFFNEIILIAKLSAVWTVVKVALHAKFALGLLTARVARFFLRDLPGRALMIALWIAMSAKLRRPLRRAQVLARRFFRQHRLLVAIATLALSAALLALSYVYAGVAVALLQLTPVWRYTWNNLTGRFAWLHVPRFVPRAWRLLLIRLLRRGVLNRRAALARLRQIQGGLSPP